MFTKLGPNSAQSKDGHIISIISRNELKYKETGKTMIVEREAGINKQKQWCTIIYISTITHWQPPHENEVITEEKKQQIINRICAALDFLEIKYVLE